VLALLGQQRHHDRGVDAARQQHADGHVGDHAAFHGGAQRIHQRGFPVAVRPGRFGGVAAEIRCPVDGVGVRTVGLDRPHGRRRKLAHAAVDRQRRRHHGVKSHVVVQRLAVQFGVNFTGAAGIEERTHGGREPQPTGRRRHIQRLDAQPIPRQRHHAGVPVGDGEREHPLESIDAVHAPFVKSLDHDLAVGGREEPVPVGSELLAQLLVVVDAAVEHQRQPEIGVDHRLCASRGQVDDRQPPVAECDGPMRHHPVGVGSARRHGTGHPGDCADIGRLPVPADLTADTAHVNRFRSFSVQSLAEHPGDLATPTERRVHDPRPAGSHSRQRRGHHVRRHRAARGGPKMDERAQVDVMRV